MFLRKIISRTRVDLRRDAGVAGAANGTGVSARFTNPEEWRST